MKCLVFALVALAVTFTSGRNVQNIHERELRVPDKSIARESSDAINKQQLQQKQKAIEHGKPENSRTQGQDDDSRGKLGQDDYYRGKLGHSDYSREKLDQDDYYRVKLGQDDVSQEKLSQNADSREKLGQNDNSKNKLRQDDDSREEQYRRNDSDEELGGIAKIACIMKALKTMITCLLNFDGSVDDVIDREDNSEELDNHSSLKQKRFAHDYYYDDTDEAETKTILEVREGGDFEKEYEDKIVNLEKKNGLQMLSSPSPTNKASVPNSLKGPSDIESERELRNWIARHTHNNIDYYNEWR